MDASTTIAARRTVLIAQLTEQVMSPPGKIS